MQLFFEHRCIFLALSAETPSSQGFQPLPDPTHLVLKKLPLPRLHSPEQPTRDFRVGSCVDALAAAVAVPPGNIDRRRLPLVVIGPRPDVPMHFVSRLWAGWVDHSASSIARASDPRPPVGSAAAIMRASPSAACRSAYARHPLPF